MTLNRPTGKLRTMITVRQLLCGLSALAFVLVLGCSSGSKSTPSPTAASAVSTTTSPQPTSTPQSTTDRLGLVYIDQRTGQAQLFVAGFDGKNPRSLGPIAKGTRATDLSGANLLLAASDSLTVMNLAGGQSTKVAITGNVTFARLLDDTALLYAVVSGCGPPGPPKSRLMLADLKTQQQKELLSFPSGNLTIAEVDAATGTAVIVPRGCDVTTSEIDIVKLADGTKQAFAVQGCGFVDVALAQKLAIVSWLACTRPEAHKSDDASLYQLDAASPVARALTAPAGGSNTQPWLLRPGQPQAVLGTSTKVSGPGGSVSSGLWLLDLTTLAYRPLAPASGLEQSPLAWSPDGRYLLATTVQAQGLCAFSYIDMVTQEVRPVDAAVTFCGANGDVLGWAVLP
jgi:hypothetical protein